MELIDKIAVIMKIEQLQLSTMDKNGNFHSAKAQAEYNVLCELDCFLDTLEVKEVGLDFEQELYKAFGQVKDFTLGMRIAKHFYELGLNAKKGK